MLENKFSALDLFCGAGGLTVGLKKAGFRVVAGIELDEHAAKSYSLNHKKHKLYIDDIRLIDPKKVLNDLAMRPGDLDLLAGCPPCQGFSTHTTKRKNKKLEEDERNNLVFEFVRFVKVMLPKTIMMENVPGLANDIRIVKVKLELKKLGYYIDENTIQIKDVSNYGVPQRRKRMILLASRFGVIESPREVKNKPTVRDVIYGLPAPGLSGDILHDLPEVRSEKVMEMIKLIPKDGGSRTDLPKKYWLPCHIKYPNGYIDVYGRMKWDSVSPTITGGCVSPSKGRFLHPEQNRSITLREAALLQTFPSNYRFSMGRGKDGVALMIGNALPPEFIRRHAIQIKKHLETF